MNRLNTIVLDFDGVLVESNAIKDQAFEIVFGGYPVQLPKIMEYHRSTDRIRFEKFRYICEDILGLTYTKELEARWAKAFSDYVIRETKICPWVEGAQRFLERFYPTVPLYLVSVNPKVDLETILRSRDIRKYFKNVFAVTGDKTDALRAVMSLEKADGANGVFIGDSRSDFDAARKAGIDFVGRESGDSLKNVLAPVFKNMDLVRDHIMRSWETD